MRFPPFNPYIAVVIGVISVSTSAVLVKLAFPAPSGIIAFYRLFLAVVVMAPCVYTNDPNQLKHIIKEDWLLSILAGVFLAFHCVLWCESLNYTSAASSVVLVTLQPIFASIGTYLFFRERFSYGAIISLII